MLTLLHKSLHPVQANTSQPPALTPDTLLPARSPVTPLLPRHAGHCRLKDAVIETHTGPLGGLKNRSTLVMLDLENIDRSAQDLGYAVDYYRLAQVLRDGIGGQAYLATAFSHDDARVAHVLQEAGWSTYVRKIDVIYRRGRPLRLSNADTAFATAAGVAAAALNVTAICLGSGDGELFIDMVRCLRALIPRVRVYATLSLPGSTSRRLDARRSQIFDINIEVGADVLRPLSATVGQLEGMVEPPLPNTWLAPTWS